MTPWPRQLCGVDEIARALDADAPVRLVLVCRERGARDPRVVTLLERVSAMGLPVRRGAPREVDRMSRTSPPAIVLALVGPRPLATDAEILAGPGAAWLLTRVEYATNAGVAARTVEVAGADGIFLDMKAPATAALRRSVLRASIRADRYLPVRFVEPVPVVEAARAAGRRIIAIEDIGERAPWDVDLSGRVLCVLGGEKEGVPRELLDRCDDIVRIPMVGFIPSYNLQAAVACIATERLRQLAGARDQGAS